MQLSFYDNTIPYTSGILANQPLLGTANVTWDFTASGGLGVGGYVFQYFDLTAFNITVPLDIFVTQQFTETSGTSSANGILCEGAALVGTSPNEIYIKTDTYGENLYAGYQIGISLAITTVPEPSTLALAALGGLGLLLKFQSGRLKW